MPDPILKRFGYGQLWPLRPESARIVYAGSHFPHPFQLRFSKEDMDHIAQNRPGSDLDGVVRIWPNASGLEASRCAVSGPVLGRTQPTHYQFLHFQIQFHSSTAVPDNIVQNQPGSDLVLADCVRFCPNGSSMQESSGPLLANASQPIRT